jgi:hypothetical protein
MKSLGRHQLPASTGLLLRILERPGLVAAIRELPGAVLGKLIDRIGLEDAGDLVALASTAQLERILDDDLWRADRAGDHERFRPERFALWLRVMLEAGEDHLVQRLCELPQDLLALAVQRLVLVIDLDVLADQLDGAGEEAEPIERALETSTFEEWEEFRLIARDPDVWDDVWSALLSLDRDHHDRLRELLEQCCAMSTEYISGQGGLYQVLTADEMLEGDVAAARDDRRVAEGFISPADARAFLELARRGDGADQRDPITRAYFRGLRGPDESGQVAAAAAPPPDLGELAALLGEVGVIMPAANQLLPALTSTQDQTHLAAPLFEQAMTDLRHHDPERFSARVQELGYLVNVWIAGGRYEGRPPRATEALETVLRTCDAGMRAQLPPGRVTPEQALALLVQTPADALFRRGFQLLATAGTR